MIGKNQTPLSIATLEKSRRDAESTRMTSRVIAQLVRFFVLLLGRRVENLILRFLPLGISARLLNNHSVLLEVYAGNESRAPLAQKVLIVTHELSNSGAPKIVYEIARALLSAKHDVIVVCSEDGPFRPLLQEAGATVVIDSRALQYSPLLKRMAATSDLAICNTVVTFRAVKLLSSLLPTYWYLHEISLTRSLLELNPAFQAALILPRQIWAGSELAAELVRSYRSDIEVLRYGLDEIKSASCRETERDWRIKIAVFGSFEPRKGQDLALEALITLKATHRSKLRIKFFGRILDKEFYNNLNERADAFPEVEVHGELSRDEYADELLAADAVLVPSRDDTLPIVSLDALGSGRILLCTRTTGTAAFITHGISGFLADVADATSIARMIAEAIDQRAAWPKISAAGRKVFLTNFSRAAFQEELISRLNLVDGALGASKK